MEVTVEKEYGVVGKISYSNGINRYFRGTTFDINTMGSSEIVVTRIIPKIFMKEMGYPVIPWKNFIALRGLLKLSLNRILTKLGSLQKDLIASFY